MEENITDNTSASPTPPMGEPTREQKNSAVFVQAPSAHSMLDDVPFEEVPLPSNGVLYPEGSPLHGRTSVDIRVMTAREEDILSSRALIKKGTVITELLNSCIMDKTVDVQDMIAGDRNAIMVALRITGYGADYPAEIECSDCEHIYKNDFNLAALPIKRLKDIEPIKNGFNLFKFTLPISNQEVHFKFLTGKDEEEISTIQDRMKKIGNVRDSFVTTRLKYSIVKVGDLQKPEKIARFIDVMRAGDSRALRKYMTKHEPGIIMRQNSTCPMCDNEEEVVMPLGAQFFWPD